MMGFRGESTRKEREKDNRSIFLWVLLEHLAQARGDGATAESCFNEIIDEIFEELESTEEINYLHSMWNL